MVAATAASAAVRTHARNAHELRSQPAGLALPRLGACTAEVRWTGARGFLRVEQALRRGAQEDTYGATAPSCGQEPETVRWLVRQADNADGLEARGYCRQRPNQQTLGCKVADTVVEQKGALRPTHLCKKGA
jgi:hypothetical protein